VCTGNICRSPTAEVLLTHHLSDASLIDPHLATRVSVDSSGLGDWHVGDPMDRRSASVLHQAGFDPTRHRAQQLPHDWQERYDLVCAMDSGHLRDLRNAARGRGADAEDLGRIRLFRDFDPAETGGDVPDPYYGGAQGFREVLAMIDRTCRQIVDQLARGLART
jgi:protein-tyrosine phosphatase